MAIVFDCSGCGRQLRAADDAAGRQARCPQCNSVTEIPAPQKAERAADTGPAEYGLADAPPAAKPDAAPPSGEPTRPCPYCGETIHAEASKCRFCGEYLEPPPGVSKSIPPMQQYVSPYAQPPDAFEFGTCISQGWTVAKDQYGLFVGVSLLVLIISMGAQSVPYLGVLAAFLVTPHLTAGQYFVGLKAFRGHQPELTDMFEGFRCYGVVVGTYFLLAMLTVACMIPAIGGVGAAALLAAAGGRGPMIAAWIVGAIGGLVSVVLAIYVSVRFMFLLLVAVDRHQLGVVECLQEASRITEGRRPQVFLFMLVLGLLMLGTSLLCCVGLFLLGSPIQMGAMGAAYYYLTRTDTSV